MDREIASLLLILTGMFWLPLTIPQNTEQPTCYEEPSPTPEPTVTPTPTPAPFVATPTEEPTTTATPTPEPTVSENKPENLIRYRVTCYLAGPGSRCADGTPPYHGALASNMDHLGQSCNLYREDGTLIGEFVSHDVGGHYDLRSGRALDIYRNSMEDAWLWLYENAWIENGQFYVWCEWK